MSRPSSTHLLRRTAVLAIETIDEMDVIAISSLLISFSNFSLHLNSPLT